MRAISLRFAITLLLYPLISSGCSDPQDDDGADDSAVLREVGRPDMLAHDGGAPATDRGVDRGVSAPDSAPEDARPEDGAPIEDAAPRDGAPIEDSAPPIEDAAPPVEDAAPPVEDALSPDAAPPSCALPEGTMDIDPDGPDTQIHGAVSFDGVGVWVAYNRMDESRGFDVWATRISCDPEARVAPFRVNINAAGNETDPAIVASPEGVLIAWQSDSGQGSDNLSLWYRIYDADGAPRMEEDVEVPFDGNIWMAAAARTPDGFAVVGAAAPEGYNVWQAWLQRVDLDGALVGEGIHVHDDPAGSQVFPAVASEPDGALYVSWERQTVDGPSRAEVIEVGSADPDEAAPSVGNDSLSAVMCSAKPRSRAWMALQAGALPSADVAVRAVRPLGGAPLTYVEGDGANHTPAVAAGAGVGAVVWYENHGGLNNDVWIQTFEDDEGRARLLDRPDKLNGSAAAPYPSGICAVSGGWFVVWAEGRSPAFRLKGAFVR